MFIEASHASPGLGQSALSVVKAAMDAFRNSTAAAKYDDKTSLTREALRKYAMSFFG
jgi:hypothetical protein